MYFIDIETIPSTQKLVGNPLRDLFQKRFKSQIEEMVIQDPPIPYDLQEILVESLWREKASLQAEFGKIVCVCVGTIRDDEILVKIFASRFEKLILEKLLQQLDRTNNKGEPINIQLCAHNGLEFDFPYLFRRYQINGLPIPRVLDTNSSKKWEWPLHDTMQLWSHTQWNYKCSLDLMCNVLGIPSPKGDVTGADVSDIYYGMFDGQEDDKLPFDKETQALEKIGSYCAGDVIALARLWCKLKGKPVPSKASIVE